MPLLQTIGSSAARAFGFTRGGANGGGAMELISTQVLASTAATVTFSSIPQTYKHLQLRITNRDSGAVTVNYMAYMWLNGDNAANYSYHELTGSGTAVTSSATTGQPSGIAISSPGNSNTTGIFGSAIVDVLDYTSTSKYKTWRSLTGAVGASKTIELNSSLWRSTAAVTSLTIQSSGSGSVAGSRFSLYGVPA